MPCPYAFLPRQFWLFKPGSHCCNLGAQVQDKGLALLYMHGLGIVFLCGDARDNLFLIALV